MNRCEFTDKTLALSNITQAELAAKIGISIVHINKNMKKLQIMGVVRRVGPKKGGYWEVGGGESGKRCI